MPLDLIHELADQLDWHWQHHLRPGLEGLADEEYLWEPVPGWSLRPRGLARSSHAAGPADVLLDFAMPEPDPPPVTTIAWRMAHVAVGVFGERAASHFGAPPITYETAPYSLSAADGLALLDRTYGDWMTGVRGLDVDELAQPCGPAEGPFAEYPMAALVLHVNREAIHHGAEMLLLRDLYRRRADL
jgi:DinB superfamily